MDEHSQKDLSRGKALCAGPRRPFTEEEIKIMRDFFDDPIRSQNHKAWRDRALFYILCLTGFRGHEVACMRWDYCFNFEKGSFRECIFIPRRYTKGARATRRVWSSSQLKYELAQWKMRWPMVYGRLPTREDLVVSSIKRDKAKRPLAPETLWRIIRKDIFDKACKDPRFDPTFIGVHSCRKFAISKRFKITKDAFDAAKFAGHAHPQTTMRYISGPNPEEENQIAKRMRI